MRCTWRSRGPLALIAAGAIGILTWPAASEACTCVGPVPACQATWQADAVFVATVIGIEDMPRDPASPLDSRRVRVRISEAFRGTAGDEVEVQTGRGGGDCGYGFVPGQPYLIYAYRVQGSSALSTGICSRTRRLADAGDDLAYLRGPARNPSSLGMIRGTAELLDPKPGGGYTRSTVAGVRVIAAGEGRSYETSTNGSGEYVLAVPVGRYDVRAEVPAGQYASPGFPRVDVLDARGCAGSDISVRWDGRISGRLLNSRGEPVPFLPVELIPPDRLDSSYAAPAHAVRTDDQGHFEFARVEPGVFHLGVNTRRTANDLVVDPRVLFAGRDGSPSVFSIGPAGRIAAGDFTLPPSLEVILLAGTVLTPDGSPKAGARVYVRLDSRSNSLAGPAVTTTKDGSFLLSVIRGYRYKLIAEGEHEGRFASSGESAPIDTASEVGRVTLRLRPPR